MNVICVWKTTVIRVVPAVTQWLFYYVINQCFAKSSTNVDCGVTVDVSVSVTVSESIIFTGGVYRRSEWVRGFTVRCFPHVWRNQQYQRSVFPPTSHYPVSLSQYQRTVFPPVLTWLSVTIPLLAYMCMHIKWSMSRIGESTNYPQKWLKTVCSLFSSDYELRIWSLSVLQLNWQRLDSSKLSGC